MCRARGGSNLATGAKLEWRADQRFVMCSTFKLALVACVLARGTLTAFWRATGDAVSRPDHAEPLLNRSALGDPYETTTPAAMAGAPVQLHSLVVAIGRAVAQRLA